VAVVTVDLKDLKRKAEAATGGRWQWFGNTKMNEVYLATVDGGHQYVMDFVRWGMRSAQPRFQVRLDGGPGTGIERALGCPGTRIMRALGEMGAKEHPLGPKFEAPHRRHFTGIGHPDAVHIAANSPEVTLGLIARIEELEAVCSAAIPAIRGLFDDDVDDGSRVAEVCAMLRSVVAKGIP
jgi:hypothetical protein